MVVGLVKHVPSGESSFASPDCSAKKKHQQQTMGLFSGQSTHTHTNTRGTTRCKFFGGKSHPVSVSQGASPQGGLRPPSPPFFFFFSSSIIRSVEMARHVILTVK